jgi:hypothetical protein
MPLLKSSPGIIEIDIEIGIQIEIGIAIERK